MIPYEKKEHYTIDDLAEIVTLLRSEEGCPWDKVQTHQSIRSDLIEETYEVIEAIDQDDPEMLREELGDLLLQVVFHTRIETEQEHFTLEDVCTDICNKLIVRHPHVFSTVQADTTEEVLKNWDAIKEETKHQTTRTQTLEAVAKTLPALMRAQCNERPQPLSVQRVCTGKRDRVQAHPGRGDAHGRPGTDHPCYG